MENYYQGATVYPAHLSVGVVLVNDKSEICTLYYKTLSIPQWSHLTDFYILMRESVELGETLEQTALRGIQEEFGATGEIQAFLGSRKTYFMRGEVKVEKTTVFFLAKCVSFDVSTRTPEDAEVEGEPTWVPIADLKEKMRLQFERLKEEDINELEMVERAEHFLSHE